MVEATSKKPRRLWKFAFALSLALNLAVVGLIAGVGLRSAGGKPPQAFEFGLGPIGQALSPEQRRSIARELRSNPDLRGSGRRGQNGMMGAVIEVLRSDNFDPAMLEAALDQPNDRMKSLQAAAKAAFIAHVSEMTEVDRLAFADRIEETTKRRRRN